MLARPPAFSLAAGLCLVLLSGCGRSPNPQDGTKANEPEAAPDRTVPERRAPLAPASPVFGPVSVPTGTQTARDPDPPPPLEVQFLGVAGFILRVGGESVLTAPMFSNPSLTDITVGEIASKTDVIDELLPDAAVADTKAILVGHAHYDHLMDVPYVLSKTADARIYGNMATERLLSAFATLRDPLCTDAPPPDLPAVPRDRVIALNNPARDVVDYRNCADAQSRCPGAWDGGAGEWVHVPNSHIRIRALCSSHPDQFLFFHLGSGCVDEDACSPPPSASDWREGSTIAFLIDFLDPTSNAPMFRIYYQDAPTDAPVGHVPEEILDEKRVDLALLCVGNFSQVADHPAQIIHSLDPRYVIGGHWENMFIAPTEPVEPLPFHDVDLFYEQMLAATASTSPTSADAIVDGAQSSERAWMPVPMTSFELR